MPVAGGESKKFVPEGGMLNSVAFLRGSSREPAEKGRYSSQPFHLA
jgi:hypothetical protein